MNPKIDKFGTKRWFNSNGQRHRLNGPAEIFKDGCERWFKDGNLHREDGPAESTPNGDRIWFKNGQLHREDGPAVNRADGIKRYFLYGVLYNAVEHFIKAGEYVKSQ